jgi:hypothetical protein
MAGCGGLSAGVRHPGQPPRQRRNRPGCPPPSDPSGEVTTLGGHRPHRTSAQRNRHRRRCVRPPVNPPGRRTPRREASAAAPPLQVAVVRHGSGHRPAMRHRPRTPAVRSAASGPVAVHRRNDQRPCPSRLRHKGRSGCVQAAAMAPVGGHLTAAGGTLPGRPVRPQDDVAAQDRTPQAADGQSADRSSSLQLPLPSSSRLRAAAFGGRPRRTPPALEPCGALTALVNHAHQQCQRS